ncbi:hypothetical protein, partial [Salmonella enterica]|uniref:hypothetical protein n=1 Tax=Salmonella enterica TaxID=28901 RepID=UPI002EB44B8F|nr:hypothetical protein [Salmonella enterica subsp. enterica serovar Paratyphi A]
FPFMWFCANKFSGPNLPHPAFLNYHFPAVSAKFLRAQRHRNKQKIVPITSKKMSKIFQSLLSRLCGFARINSVVLTYRIQPS